LILRAACSLELAFGNGHHSQKQKQNKKTSAGMVWSEVGIFIHSRCPAKALLAKREPKDQQLARSPSEINLAGTELSSSVGTARHHVLVVCGCLSRDETPFNMVVDMMLSWVNSPLVPSSDIIP
jgi:hypothetical protein